MSLKLQLNSKKCQARLMGKTSREGRVPTRGDPCISVSQLPQSLAGSSWWEAWFQWNRSRFRTYQLIHQPITCTSQLPSSTPEKHNSCRHLIILNICFDFVKLSVTWNVGISLNMINLPIYFLIKNDKKAFIFLRMCRDNEIDTDKIEENARSLGVKDNIISLIKK